MKINLKILCLPLCVALFYNCSSDNKPGVENPVAEITAPACQTTVESANQYTTFYKPATGWVGDPMPFYENGKFHIFYLYDARNTLPTFHPWYKVTTTDFASFADNSEIIPTGSTTN